MHRTLLAALSLATLMMGPALAQDPAKPPAAPESAAAPTTAKPAATDDGVVLLSVTCADARKPGAAVTPHMITAALAGRFAVAAGHSRLSNDYVKAISEALLRACPANEANDRKLIDVAAGVAMPAKSDKDRDFATLTCTQLAPLWKDEARNMVPFLFALREGTATRPMTKSALDKIGAGLPKACREPANAQRRAIDVVKELN